MNTSRVETATGMRRTLHEEVVQLPIERSVRKERLRKTLSIPHLYLINEPSRTRERATDLWNTRVLNNMCELIRTRKSRSMNKHMRKVVFQSGMEKLLQEFNRSTENIKVDFLVQTIPGRGEPSYTYSLKFCLLTPIPESVRNAPSCTAEIVRLEEERIARAQLVGTVDSQEGESEEGIVTEILSANGGIQPQRRHPSRPDTVPPPVTTMEDIPMAMAMSVDSQSVISADDHCHISSERSWQQESVLGYRQPSWADHDAPVATAVICEVLDTED